MHHEGDREILENSKEWETQLDFCLAGFVEVQMEDGKFRSTVIRWVRRLLK